MRPFDRARRALGHAVPTFERHLVRAMPARTGPWEPPPPGVKPREFVPLDDPRRPKRKPLKPIDPSRENPNYEPGDRVRVFLNLHTGTFSVQKQAEGGKWTAVPEKGGGGYTYNIVLEDATFVVKESGQYATYQTGHKVVHSWIEGTVAEDQSPLPDDAPLALYKPDEVLGWTDPETRTQKLIRADRVQMTRMERFPAVRYVGGDVEDHSAPPEPTPEAEDDAPGTEPPPPEGVDDPYEHAEDFFGMPRDARVLSYMAWKTASAWPRPKQRRRPSDSGRPRRCSVRKVSQDSAGSSPFEIEIVEDSSEGRDEIHFGAIAPNGDALGIVILTEEDYEHEDDLVYRVRFAEVAEEAQGQGVGRALYDSVMDWAKEQKVWIAPDNSITDAARRMWHKMRHDPSIRTVHNPDRDWQTMQTHLNPMDAPEGEFMDHYVDMDINPEDMPTELTRLYRRSRREGQVWRDYVAGQVEAKVKKYGDRLQLIIEGRLPREDGRVSTVETHRVGDVQQARGVGYYVQVYPHFAAAFPELAGALATIAARPKARFAGEATAIIQDYVLDKAQVLEEPNPNLNGDLNMPNSNRLAQLGEMPFITTDTPSDEPENEEESGGKTEALVDSILACLDECGIDTGGLDHEELEKKITEHAKDIIGDVMKLQSADDEDEGEDEGESEDTFPDRDASRRVRFVREGQIAEGIIIDVTPDGTHVDVQMDQEGMDVETVPVGDLLPAMEIIEVTEFEEPAGDIADIAEPAD